MQVGTHFERGASQKRSFVALRQVSGESVPGYVNRYSNPGSVLEPAVAKINENLWPKGSLDRNGLKIERI